MSRVEWVQSEVKNWSSIFNNLESTLRTAVGSEKLSSGGERRQWSSDILWPCLRCCGVFLKNLVSSKLLTNQLLIFSVQSPIRSIHKKDSARDFKVGSPET
ncbi:hypothetical protein PPACK8108_LOCUS26538 [Phakopsora pachyrhizi]|uniref:Uncharacterized protein n=1 Tax=Phakopsora pachyrhizi TaxID=170000 RepID=A0AAV0BZG2_PHAPC|nr:hypothetical protein PPACK8108_LOCUS26535 [Phakopsora pachyrhizi]CAH7691003.1 hypothetical protein PPACK8108_LOCUS26536 [Phakopsora pachyrhizi]CAH7691004.1 hypothetical protein PPACK8108_LOCUS26537 [Phakopsora pachyrhizi]CAH7691005.1 hypothetical protein PPACK8108_LOCUS26538 [Phakopsora pachyrhizi]